MELRSLLIFLHGSLFSCAVATGPSLEAEGWTPVGSPQHAKLPRSFAGQQVADRRYAEPEGIDWRQGDALFEANAAVPQEPNDVERDLTGWQNPSVGESAESEVPVAAEDKAPLIVYPQGSGQTLPPSPSAQPDPSVPDFLQPDPIMRRHPLGSGATSRQPPPRLPPKFSQTAVRGPPRMRGPPLQSLPRSDTVAPLLTQPRQLPTQFQHAPESQARPQSRPRPRPGVRHRPRPRPRPRPKPSGGGFLDGIYNAGKRVECATKNALSDVRLQDKAFVQAQLNCVLDKGPCDETGHMIKRLTPEIIRGNCPAPCDECTNQQIRKIMARISFEYPRQWQEILAKRNRG